ncbi:hypothetical protein TNCV_2168111 [Trichonephila clavipes]|nr:hypothetical protein TNCV_2168111 [Trichonephila clavipes]
MADKDILEFVQSSTNIIDADSDDEKEMNNAAPVPASSEIQFLLREDLHLDHPLNTYHKNESFRNLLNDYVPGWRSDKTLVKKDIFDGCQTIRSNRSECIKRNRNPSPKPPRRLENQSLGHFAGGLSDGLMICGDTDDRMTNTDLTSRLYFADF